jgi:hypothetical protein
LNGEINSLFDNWILNLVETLTNFTSSQGVKSSFFLFFTVMPLVEKNNLV